MARLATYVHVHKDGASHAFGPDDEVPAWAAELITNPAAWADEELPSVSQLTEPTPPAKRAAPRKKVAGADAVQRG